MIKKIINHVNSQHNMKYIHSADLLNDALEITV